MAGPRVNRRRRGPTGHGVGRARPANGRVPKDMQSGRLEQLALTVDGDDDSKPMPTRDTPQPQGRAPAAGADERTHATSAQGDTNRDGAPAPTAPRPPATGGEPPLVLTVPQLEAALQLGRTRTYELIRSGEIPVLRVGRLIRISRAALELWIAQRSLVMGGDASYPRRRVP